MLGRIIRIRKACDAGAGGASSPTSLTSIGIRHRRLSISAAPAAAFHTEVAVIGGGVIGLAVARELSQDGKEVLLLEKASHICTETSSRNSEVIHAGIYYPSDSQKARCCVQGRQLLYKYCQERNIAHNPCGKLIVATNRRQWQEELPKLQRKAHSNGVTDVTPLSKEDVQYMEPEIECLGALMSPSSGVVDSHTFFVNMLGDCEDAGAMVALNTEVTNAEICNKNGDTMFQLDSIDTQSGETTRISCDAVVNSAGLWAGSIAKLFHKSQKDGDVAPWQPPRQYFAKGTYFSLHGPSPTFQHLIYPVPEPGGLGVHATIGWNTSSASTVKFGPDVEWVPTSIEIPDEISYQPDPARGDKFYAEIAKYWPGILESNRTLTANFLGVRPKLAHPDSGEVPFQDFCMAGPQTHGIPGLIHLLGMESPGLTSSMSIAQNVRGMLLKE
jgi:L-2-hydroxyglutarate oxidase LhgO